MKKKEYNHSLRALQIELVKLQRHVIANDQQVLILFEGRDGAGKDSSIKAISQHMSPRETRIVALAKPSDREAGQWYFQRFVPHLPAPQEMVLFNRSWYNRAGVEKVMGFCDQEQYDRFMDQAPEFERMLVRSGIRLFKFYLDISKEEQVERLTDRVKDPLKAWKLSAVDQAALGLWDDYTDARNVMFSSTHRPWAPWLVVKADSKRQARLNMMRYVLQEFEYEDKEPDLAIPDLDVIFEYDSSYIDSGKISR